MAVPVPACGAGSKPLWGAHVGTLHIMRHMESSSPRGEPRTAGALSCCFQFVSCPKFFLLHVCLTAVIFNACVIPFWVDVCVSLDPMPLTDIPSSLAPHCPGRSVSVLGGQAQTG